MEMEVSGHGERGTSGKGSKGSRGPRAQRVNPKYRTRDIASASACMAHRHGRQQPPAWLSCAPVQLCIESGVASWCRRRVAADHHFSLHFVAVSACNAGRARRCVLARMRTLLLRVSMAGRGQTRHPCPPPWPVNSDAAAAALSRFMTPCAGAYAHGDRGRARARAHSTPNVTENGEDAATAATTRPRPPSRPRNRNRNHVSLCIHGAATSRHLVDRFRSRRWRRGRQGRCASALQHVEAAM